MIREQTLYDVNTFRLRDFYTLFYVPGASLVLSDSKETAWNAGDPDLIPGLRRFPGEVNGNLLQLLTQRISMYREASWFTVHGSQRVRHNWMTNTFSFTLCSWICSSVSYFTVYGNLNRIFILLLCENCINLNYVKWVHSAFLDKYILLLHC